MVNYNLDEIQKEYDSGSTFTEIGKKYGISTTKMAKYIKDGKLEKKSRSESTKLAHEKGKYPKKLSEETKKKISDSRKKYLEKNPHKVPYLLNHYTNGESYPETYFSNVFEKEFIKVDRYIQEGIYQIDFAIIDKSIAIEVDGEQHYLDKNIVESDKRKNKYLKEKGWDLIRIRWSHYQKLNKEEKKEYINILSNYIVNQEIKPYIKIKTETCECGDIKHKTSRKCRKCFNTKRRKDSLKDKPSYKTLIKKLSKSNYSALGREYGVSDNSIRKWIKSYEKLGEIK